MTTIDQMKDRLARIRPTSVDIFDDSASHAGHAGVQETGGGHYELSIVSEAFSGKTTLQRHRMIYECLADLMPGKIHALSIQAFAPEE
ncbi:MAG: BolA family transcriptional regulator [Burkholderiales bacterium]|jgi:BolA protein|nr:BolA family transcriptional regulator [Burkholderiales bacterium]MBL6878626.1 BolA family transcriptional regulator [Burkholderiales bacterium]MBT5949507.1 BolA family transcriptional regulator [Betaproteobacteria bacterium]MCH1423899.1 BolA family transcriptional regulator [Burkholderiales bacterium]